MIIRALVQYVVLGDNEYSYIETFEIRYKQNNIYRLEYCWRLSVIRRLMSRGIFCEWIKDLSVEYVRD